MRTRIAQLRWKEVISLRDGSRFGYVEDMELDVESGQVRALVAGHPSHVCSAFWAGRRTATSPGALCAALERILF